MSINPRTKSATRKLLSWAAAVASLTIMAAAGSGAAQAEVKTLEAGKLNIGMNGDMPMTQLKDGVLSGTDGEIMTWVAGKIGLTPNVHQMDWAALIEATKQGKLDVMHGAMGWIEPRTKIMILSEPIYYFGTLLAQKQENNFTTFADMKGRKFDVSPLTGAELQRVIVEMMDIPDAVAANAKKRIMTAGGRSG